MKNAVFALFLTALGLLALTGCKKSTNPNAFLLDPSVQAISARLTSAEGELKTAESAFLDAQSKYLAAKKTLSDTYDLLDTYNVYKEKLEIARRRHSYYTYRLKYEKLAAQERYLRSAHLSEADANKWIDKERASRIESNLLEKRASGATVY